MAQAHEPSLVEVAERIADEYGVSRETLKNLIECESRWDPLADNGEDRGLAQINRFYHPEISDTEAFDPNWAITYMASEIAAGRQFQWVCGSCVQGVRLYVPNLPRGDAKDLIPNSNMQDGEVVKLLYGQDYHLSAKLAILPEGLQIFECNGPGAPGKCRKRIMPWDEVNTHLVGFYSTASETVQTSEE